MEPGDEVAFLETDSGYELPPSSVGERFEQCHGALDPDATMAERTAELRNWPLSETRDDADEQ